MIHENLHRRLQIEQHEHTVKHQEWT